MFGFPPVPSGEPIRVSATAFVAFRRCPASAEARWRGLYAPETVGGFAGALAHRVFAHHLQHGPIGAEDFGDRCRREIGASLNPKLGALGLRPSQLSSMIEETQQLYERFRRLPHEGFLGAEHDLRAEPAEGVELVGKVDAVFESPDGLRLVDWKTGDLGDAHDQLGFYALVWALEHDVIPAQVEAVSVRTGERAIRAPTAEDLAEVAGQVADVIRVIRLAWAGSEAPGRRGGPWCRWCVILAGCDEGAVATSLN